MQCCGLMHTPPYTNYIQKYTKYTCTPLLTQTLYKNQHVKETFYRLLEHFLFFILLFFFFTCMNDVLLRIMVAPHTVKDFSSPNPAVKSRQAQRNQLAFIVQVNEFTARQLSSSHQSLFPFILKRILKDCTLNPCAIWK